MDHSPSSGPLEMICLCMVGKPKGQRGQVTCPYPHSPRSNGKRHLPQAVEISPLWQPELAALPGPRSRVCKLGCPRGSARGRQKSAAWPSRPHIPPCGPRAGLRLAPPTDRRQPATPSVLRAGAVPHFPSPRKANFSAGVLYLFGGFAAAKLAVSAAHYPPGAPGRRLPTPGPPEDLAVPALLPAPRASARAAGETLKLNLKAQT